MARCAGCRDARPPFLFTMAFQPVVDLALHRIDSHEALVRGCGGEGAYSVLAQVNQDTLYSFDQACRVRAIELAASLGLSAGLNINFMPNAVYDPKACIRLTLDAAARTGMPLTALTFEIVEGEDIADVGHLASIIREYRLHGFKVALDDFGTAYSGLSRLADLRPDVVKLDRALVAGCDSNEAKHAILVSMSQLCRKLGIKLVAEGVETQGELEAVVDADIRFVQGFYFARPAFERLLRDDDIPALQALPEAAFKAFA